MSSIIVDTGLHAFVADQIDCIAEHTLAHASPADLLEAPALAIWAEIDLLTGCIAVRVLFGDHAELPAKAVDDGVHFNFGNGLAAAEVANAILAIRAHVSSPDLLAQMLLASRERILLERQFFKGVAA